jgi:hypothetical protein
MYNHIEDHPNFEIIEGIAKKFDLSHGKNRLRVACPFSLRDF